MRSALRLVAVLALVGCSTGPNVTVNGTWRGSYDLPNVVGPCNVVTIDETVVLTQIGDSLSGTYTMTDCKNVSTGAISNASVNGQTISFDSGWGTFAGTWSGNIMSGSLVGENQPVTLMRART